MSRAEKGARGMPEPPFAPPPGPVPVLPCSGCGEGIFEGDVYFRICGENYCRRCAEDEFTRRA